MEERWGRVGDAGAKRTGVGSALWRGESVDQLRMEESFGRQCSVREEAGESRQDAAGRWDNGVRGRLVMAVREDVQAGQLQSRRPEPVCTGWEAVQSSGL